MMQRLRLVALAAARALGLFALSRRLTAGQLRILCYHGASLRDEHEFRPGLFITVQTFQGRLAMLKDRGYPVLSLDDALAKLDSGTLPASSIVITIDDGWYGTYSLMGPALKVAGYPSTLYVATYYMEKGTQVFNVAAAYALWKAREATLSLEAVVPGWQGHFELSRPASRDEVLRLLDEVGERLDSEGRQALLRRLCDVLKVDWQAMVQSRQFAFMDAGEAGVLAANGVSLQLHTHRHRFPEDPSHAFNEITDNRQALRSIVDAPTPHFCYPSGVYALKQLPWLKPWGIRSAVTTERGLVSVEANRLALPRLLDSEQITALEFEAELSGFRQIVRQFGHSRLSIRSGK